MRRGVVLPAVFLTGTGALRARKAGVVVKNRDEMVFVSAAKGAAGRAKKPLSEHVDAIVRVGFGSAC